MKYNDLDIISDTTKKKAELIHWGEIFVPDSVEIPFPLSSSTAGPGAGKKALALSFGETRLKLGVTKDSSVRFSLSMKDENYQILKDGEIFIENVEIIPTLLHAPNQAFINLMDGCIYSCEFCATPWLEGDGSVRSFVHGRLSMAVSLWPSHSGRLFLAVSQRLSLFSRLSTARTTCSPSPGTRRAGARRPGRSTPVPGRTHRSGRRPIEIPPYSCRCPGISRTVSERAP